MTTITRTTLQRTLGSMLRDEAKSVAQGGTLEDKPITSPLMQRAVAEVQAKKPGKPVTVTAVVDVEMAAAMKLIDAENQSKGRRGYTTISKAEVQAVAASQDPAAAEVVKAYEVLTGKKPSTSGVKLAAELGKLCDGLCLSGVYGNESDGPLSAVHFAGKSLSTATAADVAHALGIKSSNLKRDMPRFESADKADDDGNTFFSLLAEANSYNPALAGKVAAVSDFLRKNLTSIVVVVLGRDDGGWGDADPIHKKFVKDPADTCTHPLLVLGQGKDGSLVGMRSDLIWT